MKIAIDLDNTISDTMPVDFALCYIWNKQHHPDDNKLYIPNDHNPPTTFGMSKEEDDEFYIHQRQQVKQEGLIYPKIYVDKVLNKLLKEGHEIYILTSRGDLYWGNAEKETIKWLEKYNINFSKVYTNCDDKGDFCVQNKIDILIDDNDKYLKQANDLGVKTITMLSVYNLNYQNDLNYFASCWPEAYDKIQLIEKLTRKR